MSDFNPFDELLALLSQKSAVQSSIDRPFKPDGEWWLDLTIGDWSTNIVWKPHLGFGLFTSEEVFGQRPDEVFSDVVKAANRLRQLAVRTGDETPTMTLKDVRQLLGKTQQNLAELLVTGQAEISRLEARDDTHVDRFRRYVEVLGGKLELTVTFPDFRGPITLPSPEAPKRVTPRSAPAGRRQAHV